MNAAVQDVELASEFLTAKQEAFARLYVEHQNATTAYRLAYETGWNASPKSISVEACRTLAKPQVALRVAELQAQAAASTIIKARDILDQQMDVATADPNDLVRIESRNCRHCWGIGHEYQWQDAEYAYKLQDALDAGVNSDGKPIVRAPSDRGGYGYDPQREPNAACPHCYGAGVRVVFVTDSAKLTGKARRLYKGVKMDRFGSVEVQMTNQETARSEVAKLLGAYQSDGKVGELGLPPPTEQPLDPAADPADGYMAMVTRKA